MKRFKLSFLFFILFGCISCYPTKLNKEGFISSEEDFKFWSHIKIGDKLTDIEGHLVPMFKERSDKLDITTLYYGSEGGFRKMEPAEYFYFDQKLFDQRFSEKGLLSEGLPLFVLIFENNRLVKKIDPFGGRSSLIHYIESGEKRSKELTTSSFIGEGVPSKPEIILPDSNRVFKYEPYYFDMRWIPCKGSYPMKYEVQIDTLIQGKWNTRYRTTYDTVKSSILGGKNKRRVRVRASNSEGVSEWSEYRYFEFTK